MSRKIFAANFAASYGLIAAELTQAKRNAQKVLGERDDTPRRADL